jgi:hypothetical protein
MVAVDDEWFLLGHILKVVNIKIENEKRRIIFECTCCKPENKTILSILEERLSIHSLDKGNIPHWDY